MKEYSGLKHIRENNSNPYCPKCGNCLQVVDNGFFHGELFFCPKEKLVFRINLLDITKKAGDKFINQCIKHVEINEIRNKINLKNIEEIKKIIKQTNDNKQ